MRGAFRGTAIAPTSSSIDMFDSQGSHPKHNSSGDSEGQSRVWEGITEMGLRQIMGRTAQLGTIWEVSRLEEPGCVRGDSDGNEIRAKCPLVTVFSYQALQLAGRHCLLSN